MEGVKPYKELNQIPTLDYEGYVWFSNDEYPKKPNEVDFKNIGQNPFIQEALLFSKKENVSVMVRHTGDYHISEFHLNEFPKKYEMIEKQYYPHRLGFNDKRVCISQLWIPEPDPNCEGMEVLTLKAHLFTGFKVPKN